MDAVGLSIAKSMLSVVLSQIRARRIGRLEGFTNDLERRVAELEFRANCDHFGFLCSRAMLALAMDDRDFKHHLLAQILTNAYQIPGEHVESSIFVSLVERLDTHHVVLLRTLRDTKGTDLGFKGDRPPAIGFAFLVEQLRCGCNISGSDATDLSTAALNELIQAGLVHTRINAASEGRAIVNINPVGLLRMQAFRLSPLGLRFTAHLANGEPSESTAIPNVSEG